MPTKLQRALSWLTALGRTDPVQALEDMGALGYTGSTDLSCWGDSLTAGAGGTPYPTYLRALIGRPVYNGGVGGETSTQIAARMLPATSRHGDVTIIWAGRNNFHSGATVQADVASMVAALGHDRYLVLSVLNASDELTGTANLAEILAINAAFSSAYGAHYLDVRSYLVTTALADLGITPTSQDVTDAANNVVPTSLRSDTIHLNADGYHAVANYVFAHLPAEARSAKWLGTALASPGEIGGATPAAKITTNDLYVATRRINAAGDTHLQVASNWYPAANFTFDLGSTSLWWRQVRAARGFFAAQDGALSLTVQNSVGATAGGAFIFSTAAGIEKWRAGLRSASSGAEGDDWRWMYFDGSTRHERVHFLASGGIRLNGAVDILIGAGSPEGVVTAGPGSLYTNTSGGAGTTLYVKESGAGNTGWVAK